MSNRVANHLHRYKKVNLSRDKDKPYFVYKCTKPACSHYVPLELAEGKLCECNRCGEPMVINKQVLTGSSNRPMTKPHCSGCIERKNKSDVAAISEFLAGNKT
jgi:hypothetical protein